MDQIKNFVKRAMKSTEGIKETKWLYYPLTILVVTLAVILVLTIGALYVAFYVGKFILSMIFTDFFKTVSTPYEKPKRTYYTDSYNDDFNQGRYDRAHKIRPRQNTPGYRNGYKY